MGSIKKYYYDAFICCSRADLDTSVAELIQKRLEDFQLPKSILELRKPSQKKRIKNVFRDALENPESSELNEEIERAIKDSEFLIVVCTPKTKESAWIKAEIEKYIQIHGQDRILGVLVEGEPETAFPEEILYREVVQFNPFGGRLTMRMPMDPLAADVRGKNKFKVKKNVDKAALRLVAPILGVNFEELRQRDHEERMKKLALTTSVAAVACLAFGTFSVAQTYQLIRQKDEIAARSEAVLVQNNEISSQAEALEAQYGKLRVHEAQDYGETSLKYHDECNQKEALRYAIMSCTEDEDGNELPETEQGMSALFQATYAYNIGEYASPCNTYETDYPIVAQKLSPNGTYIYIENAIGMISIYQTATGKCVAEINANAEKAITRTKDVIHTTSFMDDETICYLANNRLIVYNFVSKKIVYQIECNNSEAKKIVGNPKAQCALFLFEKQLYQFDYQSQKVVSLINLRDRNAYGLDSFKDCLAISTEGDFVTVAVENVSSEVGDNTYELDTVSLATGEVVQSIYLDNVNDIYDLAIVDGKLFVYEARKSDGGDSEYYQIVCFDLFAGGADWKVVIDEHDAPTSYELIPFATEEFKGIGLIDGQTFTTIDMEEGNIVYNVDLGSKVISSFLTNNDRELDLCVDTGACFAVSPINRSVDMVQNQFGVGLEFMNYANGLFYCVSEEDTAVKVWSRHRGLRVEETESALDGALCVQLDKDMQRAYCLTYGGLEMQILSNGQIAWQNNDLMLEDIVSLSNGKILGISNETFYVIEGDNGEVLYENNGGEGWKLLNVDTKNNTLIYCSQFYNVCQFNVDTMTETEIYTIDNTVNGTNHAAFSADGRYAVLPSYKDNREDIIIDGIRTGYIDINISRIENVVILPDEPYVLVQDVTGAFDIYSLEDSQKIYSHTGAFATIRTIERGSEEYPYIFHCDGISYFMNNEFYTITSTQDTMHKVLSEDYFYTASSEHLYLVPVYTYEMLKEDANQLITGMASNEIASVQE